MDKITAVKLKYNDGSYSSVEIPIGVSARNVKLDNDQNLDNWIKQQDISSQLNDINKKIMSLDIGVVNPEKYGAYGDGIHDDTDGMIAAFDYANTHNLPVVWHGKTIYMKTATAEKCPIINTDVDFSGCTILMDSYTVGNTIFKVGQDPENITSEMLNKSINQETVNTVFENYPNSMITVDSMHYLGERFGDPKTATWYPHKQCFLTNSYGAIQPFDCFREINSYRGVYRIDKMSKPIKICFGKIIITDNATASAEIKIQRANVTIENCVIIPNNIEYIDINKAPFRVMYAYNVILRNITAINLPINSDTKVTSYIIDVHYSYKITLENICATKGWGAIATHFCTDVTMRECHVGRADFHYGVYGLNIVENCSFISYPCKIEIGYGDGTVIIRDCFFYKRVEGQIYSDVFIECRNDFSIMFSGQLIFENNTVQIYDHSTKKYSWLFTYRTHNSFQNLLEWAPNNLPDVHIKNLIIKSEANSEEYDRLQLLGIANSYNENNKLVVGHIQIECNSLDKQVKLITDFNNFDTTNAVLTLKKAFLDATNYEGYIYKDEESIVTAPNAIIRNTFFDYNEMSVVNGALEIFNDITDDNTQVLTATEIVYGSIMNLKNMTPYGNDPKYAHAIYSIDGDYPYLITGHSTSNAKNGNGALCGFYDANDNWIMSAGFEPYVKYINYRVIAPPNAVKMIVNLGAGASSGYQIEAIKILTKCASKKLNRMQAVVDDVNNVLPDLRPLPEIFNIIPAYNENEVIEPKLVCYQTLYNLVSKNTWVAGNDKYSYAVFTVTEGELYLISGSSGSTAASNGNGSLCAFYDQNDAIIGEPYGRINDSIFTDYEVTAPVGAVKLIVNRTKMASIIQVKRVIHHNASSIIIDNILSRLTNLEQNGGGGIPLEITSTVTPTLAEFGSTVNEVTIEYTINKIPDTMMLDNNIITPALNGVEVLTGLSLSTDKEWVLTASIGNTTVTKTIGLDFANTIYYGVDAVPQTLNSAFILNLSQHKLSKIKIKHFTVNANSNNYIWYAVPVRLGTCTFSVGGFIGGFELAGTISHINNSGYQEDYYVYKSINANLGITTVEVN